MAKQEYGLGALPSPVDVRDYVLSSKELDMSDIPKTYRIDSIQVKNQGSAQTCVAHTLSEIIEYHNLKEKNEYEKFSTDFIYGLRFDSEYFGEGMYLRDALKAVQKYGDVPEKDMPGNTDTPTAMKKVQDAFESLKNVAYPNRISTYFKITSPDELKYTLYHDGPVACGMKWYRGNKLSSGKVYLYDKSNGYSGHAVMIVGWDENCWIVQNSWGRTWGDKGYFRIPITTSFSDIFFDVYGVTDNIEVIKQPGSVKKAISPFANILLRFIHRAF